MREGYNGCKGSFILTLKSPFLSATLFNPSSNNVELCVNEPLLPPVTIVERRYVFAGVCQSFRGVSLVPCPFWGVSLVSYPFHRWYVQGHPHPLYLWPHVLSRGWVCPEEVDAPPNCMGPGVTRDTFDKRAVCILLECCLVMNVNGVDPITVLCLSVGHGQCD